MRIYFLISILPFFAYLFLKTKKVYQMLQQNWYNLDNRYLKWIFQNFEKNFVSAELFFLVVCGVCYFTDFTIASIFFSLFYIILTYLYYQKSKQEQVKKPLVFTKRVLRLTITESILLFLILGIILYTFQEKLVFAYYFILGVYVYFLPILACLFVVINIPAEKYVFQHFKHQAIEKLNSLNHMKVIGITGSYGKTSSKNILNDILNIKYVSFPSPKNFNTTYGLINTINNYLDKFNDYMIAEMGAFKKGEIKELCDLVKPTYGILTTIGTAHLESFGSRENIRDGKFELIESLPSDGVGILNGDDEYQLSYHLKNNCKIIWIGIDNHNVDVYAKNIKISSTGTSFDCVWKGQKEAYHFETRLLGKHNIYNILAGIALGYELGINISELQIAVSRVEPIEHRLELKAYGNIHLIDDAYNSNPVGSKMAVEVLGLMPGKKIIVTPGMIELGEMQYKLNKEFGYEISKYVDEVILVGKEQTKPIFDGLIEKKFDEKKIYILNDVKESFPLMRKLSEGKECYVLLENDLPDIFNE